MRRLLLVLGTVALAAATFAGVAHATGGSSCVVAGQASYQHAFDGPAGTVTITAAQPLCDGEEQAFSLASYTTSPSSHAAAGFLYDADSAWISGSRRSVTLDIDVPGCSTRVVALDGTLIADHDDLVLGSAGNRSTGAPASYAGGATTCAPQPSVTFDSWCDGVLSTRLSNASAANVDAVFIIGGKRFHVLPGEHTDLTFHPTGSVEVRDNSFTTSSATWTAPSDCTPVG